MRSNEDSTSSTKSPEIMSENRFDEAEFLGNGLITADELAKWLKTHVQTIYQMKARNEIPYRSSGKRRVRFLCREIHSWIETGELPESFVKRELTGKAGKGTE